MLLDKLGLLSLCIEKAWADLYFGVDTATIDQEDAQAKMEVATLEHIYRYVQKNL